MALEALAKEAGVGIGTLYRHFPTREALIDAVYRSEVARLCGGADDLVAVQAMLDAGVGAGSLRGDVRADDVVASLAGVLLASGAPDQREQAGRMLDLHMDGLRPMPPDPDGDAVATDVSAQEPVPVRDPLALARRTAALPFHLRELCHLTCARQLLGRDRVRLSIREKQVPSGAADPGRC